MTKEQWCAYLPYKVEFQDQSGAVWMLNGFYDNGDCYNNMTGEIPSIFCKPLLRPLSDLTQPITVDGKTFVPIVELAKLVDEFGYLEPQFVFSKGFNGISVYWYQKGHQDLPKAAPYALYQMLFKWHFNVFDLPKSEYINLNSIE